MKPSKYKVIKKEVERLEMEATDICPECKSVMVVYMNWGYESAECKACGHYEETERTRP